MLYLLHGADTFRSGARFRALRAELDPNGFSSTAIDAADASPDALRAACDALPFFGGGRCVEVRGMLTRWKEARSKGAEREDGAKSADPFEALATYLPQMPPTTTLLLWELGAYEPPAGLRRALQDLGKQAAIEKFDPPLGRELRDWAIGRAKEAGATLRQEAAEALLDALCPQGWREAPRGRDARLPDLQGIDTEIQKLATAVLSRDQPVITARVVDVLTLGETETNIFRLVDAAAVGDTRQALALLRSALEEGVAPELLLSLLATKFSLLVRLRAVGGARASDAVASQLGVTPYRLRDAARQLSQIGEDRVPECLRIVLEADEAIKTGRSPRSDDALYWAVLELGRVGARVPLVTQ
jgi:DNA polymerase III subunit delta